MSLDAQADVPDLCKIKTQIQTFKHPSLIAADQCWVSGFCTLCAKTQTASNTHRQQAGSHKSMLLTRRGQGACANYKRRTISRVAALWFMV